MKTRVRMLFVFLALIAALSTIAAAPAGNYRAHLSGRAQLPDPIDTQAQGQAIFRFSKDGSELYYKLIVANIENVTMAHIHVAPPGQPNGPPVLWLYPYGPPPVLIEGRFQGVLAERTVMEGDQGVLISFGDLKTAINEGRAYVNVHTNQYPAGEIRGEIH